MNALIQVTVTEQGSQTVSARELHTFLEVTTPFTKWVERMFEYGFTENQDFAVTDIFVPNPKGGKQQIRDYALTIDCGKEIAMLQRTDKGKQARQYFIDLEKQVKSGKAESLPATQDEVILMLAQRNVDNARRLSALEERMQRVEQIQDVATAELLALPAPTESMPEMPTETKISRMVNAFAQSKAKPQQDIWRELYTEMYYRYRISVNSHKLNPGESKIQMLKRLGYLDKLYVVATNVLRVA